MKARQQRSDVTQEASRERGATADPAQREAHDSANRSPQMRRLAQMQQMVDASPPMVAQARKAEPVAGQSNSAPVVQRISDGEARKRLDAESGGQDNAVAVLRMLNAVRDEVPLIETALQGLDNFIANYPERPRRNQDKYPSKRRVKQSIGVAAKKLADNVSSFLEVIDGIEDWYIDAEVKDRESAATHYMGDWLNLYKVFDGAAAAVASLFNDKPPYMPAITTHAGAQRIDLLNYEINQWFQPSGGFSAVGRAHDIGDVEITETDPEVDKDFPVSETYLGGYYQGTKRNSVADKYDVSKPKGSVVSTGPAIVIGKRVDHLHPENPQVNRPLHLNQSEMGMAKLRTSWTQEFRAPPAPRDRGDGQYANMNKTNARGYAWLNNTGGWDHTSWEWLHVQAASLGGATDGSNLVLGTRDANTLMMPFESNIRLLAGLVKEHPELDNLSVTWSVDNGKDHAYDVIQMEWTVVPKDDASPQIEKAARKTSGEIVVANLHTKSNLSKKEVTWVESELSAFRQGLKGNEG